uniref:Uncharacterized protein n=2 Tax=root TaxID=1 RepID=B3TCW1_9BACT|nr:putative protein of unknown function (DUF1178) [uncultured marine microorganism HF4000_005D21]ABZ10420.1 putative protein of unknown function (DUF1178) [uncultured marine bacterium HF4000_APKG3108]
MIKYNLICECGKTFESWFLSSDEYDIQRRKKLINCIYCDSTSVRKSVMAPNLFSKTNKTSKNTNIEKKIKKQLLELRRYIEKNCKNVGDNFPREARRIHYDKKTSKGIYGKATPEETAELLEEGIDVATIPWQNKSEH